MMIACWEVISVKTLIAYCGLDCETCEARLATINDDGALRAKVAKLWSELNGVEITPDMINCVGCRVDGAKTPYCESLCPIRQCALERKIETCGGCKEMEHCEKLGAITRNNADALNNLKGFEYITLRDRPELMQTASAWFHEKGACRRRHIWNA